MKYYDNDPKEGGKEISEWQYFQNLNRAGTGFAINPIHDFELLKEFRLKMYEGAKVKFIAERQAKRLVTAESDLNGFFVAWVNHELKVIETWLSDKYPKGQPKAMPSTSDQMEILKYEAFIKSEKDQYFQIRKPVKPCKSVARARAFCILLLQDAGQEYKFASKTELIKIVKRHFPDQSGKTIYEMIKIDGFSLSDKEKPEYQSDYAYGLKLFNDMKPK